MSDAQDTVPVGDDRISCADRSAAAGNRHADLCTGRRMQEHGANAACKDRNADGRFFCRFKQQPIHNNPRRAAKGER